MINLRELAGVAGIVFGAAYAATQILPVAELPAAVAQSSAPSPNTPHFIPGKTDLVFAVSSPPRGNPNFVSIRVTKVENEELNPGTIAQAPLPPEKPLVDPALAGLQAEAVARHLAAKLPAQLVPYFDTFIYVSKAKSGAWAQNLFLFTKSADGTFVFEQNFLVSTGRERSEQYFTTTPAGIFTLDPNRLMSMAYSGKWHNAPMPHAMFLDYSYRTQMSGVALHAAHGRRGIGDLGNRASGGCVRLPPEKAAELFGRFKGGQRKLVPVFAFDQGRGTTNVEGRVKLDPAGRIILKQGIPVLILIDGEPGPATILSSL